MPFNTDWSSEGIFIYARNEQLCRGCATPDEVRARIDELKAKLDLVGGRMVTELRKERRRERRRHLRSAKAAQEG